MKNEGGESKMVREMTEINLRSAYAGESQAHMRYTIYSDRAKKEELLNVARLFSAIAFAEKRTIDPLQKSKRGCYQRQGRRLIKSKFALYAVSRLRAMLQKDAQSVRLRKNCLKPSSLESVSKAS
jgi:rubrerythrin